CFAGTANRQGETPLFSCRCDEAELRGRAFPSRAWERGGSSFFLLDGCTPIPGKSERRPFHIATHRESQASARAGGETNREGAPLDSQLVTPPHSTLSPIGWGRGWGEGGLDSEELMLAVAAGLDDDGASVELVDIHQRHNGGIGRQFLDPGGDVFRQAGAAP